MLSAGYFLPLIALTAFSFAADPLPAAPADTPPALDSRFHEPGVAKEMQDALDHYRLSGDARYATPAHGITALHAAAALHQLPLVQELLAKGADPNARVFIREQEDDGFDGFIDVDGDGEDEVDEEVEEEEEEMEEEEPGFIDDPDEDALIADTPLTLALGNIITPRAPAAEVLPIVQALLAGGADPAAKGREVEGALTACIDGCAAFLYANSGEDGSDPAEDRRWQDIARLLIDKGAGGSAKEAAYCLTFSSGWAPVVIHLLASPQGQAQQASPGLLERIVELTDPEDTDGDTTKLLPCVRAMLLTPEMLNRPLPGNGERALATLAQRLCDEAELWDSDVIARRPSSPVTPAPAYVDLLALLLEKGADASLPLSDEANPVCAADYIACAPAVQAELLRRGFKVAPPPHAFTRENLEDLLEFIPLAAISDEEVRARRGLIESYAMGLENSWNTTVAGRALMLLYRLDPEGTRHLICDRDLWKHPEFWRTGPSTNTIAELGMAVDSLRKAPTVVLPPRWLADVAVLAERVYPGDVKPHSDKNGVPFKRARTLVRLLERDDSAEADAVLEELCAEATPLALRSAAWSTRLRREGLPDLCDSELSRWLGDRGIWLTPEQLGPELALLRRADLVAHTISPKSLPVRHSSSQDPVAQDTRAIAEALRRLGASRAAEVYEGALARPVAGGDTQDEPDADADYEEEDSVDADLRFTALMELEEAYARYFWEHREQIRAQRDALPKMSEEEEEEEE